MKLTWFGYPRYIRHTWFRLKRGFWPAEVWNLDQTIASFVVPRLEYLKETAHGYPPCFERKYGQKGLEKWDEFLGEMIWALKSVGNDLDWLDGKDWTQYQDSDWEKYNTNMKRQKAGLKKFGYWFTSLWN